ncbi:MAG: hypothetical protein JSV51_02775 [Candidatus Bathyarchaeota archaeon]|nr:MAG: hypothetical protein JSV51_02775 [Candidatus Bathyarchaeota archaeon]
MARQYWPKEATSGLDDLLMNIIDETLKHIFKEVGTNVIYDFLGNHYHLKKEEIVDKPEVFSAGLKYLLGSGASVIEKVILDNLCAELKFRLKDRRDYDLLDYIVELRKCAVLVDSYSVKSGGVNHDNE